MKELLLIILILCNVIIIYFLYRLLDFLIERKEVIEDVKEYKEFYVEEKKDNKSFWNNVSK